MTVDDRAFDAWAARTGRLAAPVYNEQDLRRVLMLRLQDKQPCRILLAASFDVNAALVLSASLRGLELRSAPGVVIRFRGITGVDALRIDAADATILDLAIAISACALSGAALRCTGARTRVERFTATVVVNTSTIAYGVRVDGADSVLAVALVACVGTNGTTAAIEVGGTRSRISDVNVSGIQPLASGATLIVDANVGCVIERVRYTAGDADVTFCDAAGADQFEMRQCLLSAGNALCTNLSATLALIIDNIFYEIAGGHNTDVITVVGGYASIIGNTFRNLSATNDVLVTGGAAVSAVGNTGVPSGSQGKFNSVAGSGACRLAANYWASTDKALAVGDIDDDDITVNNAPGSITVPTNHSLIVSGTLRLTGSQRLTVQGTGRVRVT